MALKYILDTGEGLRDGVTRNMAKGLIHGAIVRKVGVRD